MRTLKFTLIIVLSAVCGCIHAARPFRAVPDNFFMEPGATTINLDILRNDELSVCGKSGIRIHLIDTVTNMPVTTSITTVNNGTVVVNPDNTVTYTPAAGHTGEDAFYYTITCRGNVSPKVKVLIHVNDRPDNMGQFSCFVDPEPREWTIERKAVSGKSVYFYTTPLAGDLDGDGNIKIVALRQYLNSEQASEGILIFDSDLNLEREFATPAMLPFCGIPMVIADVDNDGKGEIIIAIADGNGPGYNARLICHSNTGQIKWISSDPYLANLAAEVLYETPAPVLTIADIDGDGKFEIMAGDRIFAAESGQLLATLPTGNGRGRIDGMIALNTYAVGTYAVFADMDNDGKMEIVAGNTIYKVTINNRTNPALNSAAIWKSISGSYLDGYSSVADIDGDGYLDVVTMGFSVKTAEYLLTKHPYTYYGLAYCWSPMTGKIRQVWCENGFVGGSRPLIGDINGDGIPDVAFTTSNRMMAFSFDSSSDQFYELWRLPTTDFSGATTMTLFDFNQDGIAEIVYRDETDVRVINGSGKHHLTGAATAPYNLFSSPCFSATTTEYPIVVDVDGKGEAVILASGSLTAATRNSDVRLMKFGSVTDRWAPARPVWNQLSYNPVYINDDLSIPVHPLHPTAEFIAKDGTIRRPFNNFLQQATLLNDEGLMFDYGPDLIFYPESTSDLNPTTNQPTGVKIIENAVEPHTVKIWVTNQGDAPFKGKLTVTAYEFDLDKGFVQLELIPRESTPTGNEITVGEIEIFTFSLSGVSPEAIAEKRIQIRLNQASNDVFPATKQECIYYNNYSRSDFWGGPEQVLCEDDTKVLFFPINTGYTYEWYDAPVAGDLLEVNTGIMDDRESFYKDGSLLQKLYVEIYDGDTRLNAGGREEVLVHLFPDSLIWTGTGNNLDWNDYKNWKDPNDLTPTYPKAKVPRPCTDVLIPNNISRYPNLNTDNTTRTVYPDAACNRIWFEHGGEVVRTDLLNYHKAHVELRLETNRWNMLSAPLRYMYVGDYWRDNSCPWTDKLQVYTQLFATPNPQDPSPYGSTIDPNLNPTGDWSGAFHNPEIAMPAGLGFAAWLDDETYGGEGFQVGGKHAMWFPKQETTYNIYYKWSCVPDPEKTNIPMEGKAEIVADSLHHRFVYEQNIPGSDYRKPNFGETGFNGIVTLTTTTPPVSTKQPMENKSGEEVGFRPVIVGNPFMSHWDFNAFEDANKALIDNSYWVLQSDDDAAFEIYNKVITPNDTLIAPMQSIIVSAAPGIEFTKNSLTTNVTSMRQKPGNILKSARSAKTKPDLLKVIVEKDGKQNPTYVLFNAEASNAYKWREDSYKLFVTSVTDAVSVYSRSSDDYALDINIFGDCKEMIPLGVRTSTTGTITLHFEGIEGFVLNRDLFLIDKLTGEQIDLRKTPFYSFEKTTGELFMDNRLYLSFDGVTNAAEQIHGTTSIFMQGNVLKVTSNDNIKQVQIVDAQGRTIANESNINNRAYTRKLESNGIYIVKVSTDKESAVQKVITSNN